MDCEVCEGEGLYENEGFCGDEDHCDIFIKCPFCSGTGKVR